MPRLYVLPTDFQNYPVALAFAGRIAQLAATTGSLDRLLAGASKRVDGFCHKKIGSLPTTTIGAGGLAQGATSLPVPTTLGFDNGQEEAVILNLGGGNQEILPIAPGGVLVSSWSAPYAGTLTLAQGAIYNHSAGESVIGLYQEVSTVGSSSSSDVYSESLLQMNQQAQLAAAHAPKFDTTGLTRVIFLKQYPINAIYLLEHMLPIETTYVPLQTQVGINPASGYIRLPIGAFVLPEGLFRATYTAGYQYIPDEVQRATALYAADELQNMMSYGAYELSQGKLRGKYGDSKSTKSRFVQQAEEILTNGGFVRLT